MQAALLPAEGARETCRSRASLSRAPPAGHRPHHHHHHPTPPRCHRWGPVSRGLKSLLPNCDHPGRLGRWRERDEAGPTDSLAPESTRPAWSGGGTRGHLGVPVGGHCVSTWSDPPQLPGVGVGGWKGHSFHLSFLPLPHPWQHLLFRPVSSYEGISGYSPRKSHFQPYSLSIQV